MAKSAQRTKFVYLSLISHKITLQYKSSRSPQGRSFSWIFGGVKKVYFLHSVMISTDILDFAPL
jgi:hypothetical protein